MNNETTDLNTYRATRDIDRVGAPLPYLVALLVMALVVAQGVRLASRNIATHPAPAHHVAKHHPAHAQKLAAWHPRGD